MIDHKKFVLGGNSTFTLVSERTGDHITYRVKKEDGKPAFVMAMTGKCNAHSYEYIGAINLVTNDFKLTKASKLPEDSKPVLAFSWFWRRVTRGKPIVGCQFKHAGRCCVCDRTLTSPESIETGIGPECAKKIS